MYLQLLIFCNLLSYLFGVEIVVNQTGEAIGQNLNLSDNKKHVSVANRNTNFELKRKTEDVTIFQTTEISMNNNPLTKKMKRKRRRKKSNIKKNDLKEEYKVSRVLQFQTIVSNFTTPIPKITKRRRRKKRRRKKKPSVNNLLEATTARNEVKETFNIQKNIAAFDLIKHFNQSPKNGVNTMNFNKTGGQKLTIIEPVTSRISKEVHTQTRNLTKLLEKRNRCAKNNGGCSQICKKKGKIKCSCLKGFVLTKSRKKCVDIDECKIENGGCKEICRNIQGTYYCDCPLGFRISDNLKSCQDVNECHLRNGHGPCQDTCTNTHGSYMCDCSHLNGTRLSNDQHSCQDINECAEGTSGCSHLCINTNRGAFCSCPEGMELMSDYKTCQDVDECEDTPIKNGCKSSCVNTIGSYYCEDVFQSDQSTNIWKVPVCPPLNPPQYGFITCYRNNSSPFDTYDKSGRKIIRNSPGTKCFLVCPTGFKLAGSNRFVCGTSGKWIIKKKGFCSKAPYPKLECPENLNLVLEEGRQKMLVSFPPPQTNIRWKDVKSYPKWAKDRKGELSEGHHHIQFSVTDPTTKLSATCSFYIAIKSS